MPWCNMGGGGQPFFTPALDGGESDQHHTPAVFPPKKTAGPQSQSESCESYTQLGCEAVAPHYTN
jgi:hypothetical protein